MTMTLLQTNMAEIAPKKGIFIYLFCCQIKKKVLMM